MLKEKDERARRLCALSCSQTQIYIQIIQTLRFEFRIILKPSLCYGNLLHVCPPPKTWGKVGRFQKCPTSNSAGASRACGTEGGSKQLSSLARLARDAVLKSSQIATLGGAWRSLGSGEGNGQGSPYCASVTR